MGSLHDLHAGRSAADRPPRPAHPGRPLGEAVREASSPKEPPKPPAPGRQAKRPPIGSIVQAESPTAGKRPPLPRPRVRSRTPTQILVQHLPHGTDSASGAPLSSGSPP